MKIKSLKLFQSVKCGRKEMTFITDDDYTIILKDNLFYIEDKKDNSKVCTSLHNSPWFVLEEEVKPPTSKPKSKKKK